MRYSNKEIEEELGWWTKDSKFDCHEAEIFYKMTTQLLEENRILREGLTFYADPKGEHWGTNDPNGTAQTCAHMLWETSGGAFARETLTKADNVGKGDM